MGATYHLGKDGMYKSNMMLLEEDGSHYGNHGRLCRTYLREPHQGIYIGLLFPDNLTAYLNEIDDTSNVRIDLVTKPMAEVLGVTDGLMSESR